MIINETKGKVWQGRVELADTFLKRFRGLMLVGNVNYALVFVLPDESRLNASIHMFFMLSDIDVIWLDSTRRVVDFTTARKWRMYSPKRPAKYIIEGPMGLIKSLDVEEGDVINWQTSEGIRKTIPVKVPFPEEIVLEKDTSKLVSLKSVMEAKSCKK
ncbi:hypothetical protein X802_10625 [Thermococcus guaymasensis DSM 11113]|uniref:UPF0127 protein X802_10625 n=1 Tax=Thermococcus guaymasensis DSM 11113 TaxID=1432656 RepID=A0A0X1KMU6_9EURY|nr:DUF192 domain-containing protein [Thermococcus guaymasensis]AJC72555.1 hypothetical protein X802_10625 [Thermococcus guaymasensis DSM 11113]